MVSFVLNRTFLKGSFAALAGLAMFAASETQGRAQQGSKAAQDTRARLALEGHCPVCVVDGRKWVRGNPKHHASYDGRTYQFPSESEKEKFLADPVKYVPALGGDCTVCYAKLGKRVPGKIQHAAIYRHRLFLFPGADQKKAFLAEPKTYADVDLALDGNCAVCRAELGKDVPGKSEFTTIHQGLRYQFPSEQQRKMFLADPAKYAVKADGKEQASTQGSIGQLVSIKGRSACAGCDHGVTPIGAPDELGLAVNADDGIVYVVEDAHQLYREVYEKRFDGLGLEVAGKVLKRQGKIRWIKPTELKVLN